MENIDQRIPSFGFLLSPIAEGRRLTGRLLQHNRPGGDIALAKSVKAGPSRFQALPAKTPALDHATTPDPWIGGVGLLAKVG